MKTEMYEVRTMSDTPVAQYMSLEILQRYEDRHLAHLKNYKIVKITVEEEIICEVQRKAETGAHGKSLQQVPADSTADQDIPRS